MEQEQLLPINVWLSGRSYRIKIKPEDEEAVRKALKIADNKIKEMRSDYAGKDDQDYVAMTLLMYAADSAVDVFNNPTLSKEIQKMADKIDKAI